MTSETRLLPNAAVISRMLPGSIGLLPSPLKTRGLDYAEARFVTMAPINDRLCVFAWCQRGEALRVISLRKANKRERDKYEKAIHQP
jgi:Ribonuclease toxin, BrnT, of type II toxin-antitoxin system